MKVQIMLDLPRTINGRGIGPFARGQVCDLDHETAQMFIESSMAAEYSEPKPAEAYPVRQPKPEAEPTSGMDEAQQASEEGASRRARRRAD